ncbi:MAG TPA: MFS transporter, partial [Intrasporangium sp.]|nr:MFS transporter [Intrasporangium sp.]
MSGALGGVQRYAIDGRRAWLVWASAIAVYVLAVFHRTSLGVAGLKAAERFEISSSQLSLFTIVQLAVYAAMQLPVGALLDRYGSKRLLGVGLTLMTAAQLTFAFVDTLGAALVCRVFLGMGDAMVFISVMRIVALWFSPRRSPMVTQVTGLLGQLGALLAAGPLAAA